MGGTGMQADPPWRFTNRTGKLAPEHRRLHRYPTMTAGDIAAWPHGRAWAASSRWRRAR